jgi:hypothetical protein
MSDPEVVIAPGGEEVCECGFNASKAADLSALIENEATISALGGSDGAEPRRNSPQDRDRRLTLFMERRDRWSLCPHQDLHADLIQAAAEQAVEAEPDEQQSELLKLRKDVLVEQADFAGVDSTGTKADLAARIEAAKAQRVAELLRNNKDELVALASAQGLDPEGTKADLAARIVDKEYSDGERVQTADLQHSWSGGAAAGAGQPGSGSGSGSDAAAGAEGAAANSGDGSGARGPNAADEAATAFASGAQAEGEEAPLAPVIETDAEDVRMNVLLDMSDAELRAEADRISVSLAGTRAEIAARIVDKEYAGG